MMCCRTPKPERAEIRQQREHQLGKAIGFFQALTLPIGVYATEADFTDYQITSELLKARIQLAAERAAPLFAAHSPSLLKIA